MGYLLKRKCEKYERYIVAVFLFTLPILTIFGSLGASLDWRLDFLSEFKIQAVLLSVFLFLWCAFKQKWLHSGLFLLLAFLNLALISSHSYFFQKELSLPKDSYVFSVMYQDLKGAKEKSEELRTLLDYSEADIVFLTNVPVEIYRDLGDILGSYYLQNQTHDKTGKMKLILARLPSVDRGSVAEESGAWISRVIGTRKLTFLLADFENPWSSEAYPNVKQKVFELADFARNRDEPVVVIGNFGATGWSSLLKDLETHADLKPQGTLFASGAGKPFYARRPTDHIYTHPGIEVYDIQTNDLLDTDYDTIQATFKIAPIRKEIEFLDLQPIIPEEDVLLPPK